MDKNDQNIRSPLKFLDAYGRDDDDQFFGREEEANRLFESVNKNRLVLVYGQSGTGKTSLVQCGLANRFEVTDWVPFFIRRGQDINQSLFNILAESKALGGREVNADNLLASLNRISTRYLRPIYLIFDQFEELLIMRDEKESAEQREEVDRFMELVRSILDSEQTQSVHLLFILREEYFAALDRFEKAIPQFTQRRLRVEPMRPQKLETVILETCGYFQIKLEKGAENARQILDNLKIKGGIPLPYLQVYLDMLWREDFKRTYPKGWEGQSNPPLEFTTREIADFGAIRDVLDRFLSEQTARIQAKIQLAYPKLEPDTVSQVLDAFTTSEGTKLPVYFQLEDGVPILENRAQAYLRNLPAGPLQACLDELENSRILRRDDDSYELAHDTLAEIVDKRRTDEQRRLNRLRRLVRSNYELNQTLTIGHLAELGADLDKLALDSAQVAFVEQSRKLREEEQQAILKQARRRRNEGILFGLLGLVLVMIAFWQSQNANLAQKNLHRASSTFFDAVTRAVDGYIYNLDYEKALDQLRLAAAVALNESAARSPKLGQQFFEMSFFYNEIGHSDRAIGLADTTFQLLAQSNLRADLPKAGNSPDRSLALNDLLKQADADWYELLEERYYPKMVPVKGDTYTMGSEAGDDNEQPHQVEVPDFQIARTETTLWQFYLFSRAIGLEIKSRSFGFGWTGDYPMYKVSWFEAVAYAQWVSQQKGLGVAYALDSIPQSPNDWDWQDIPWPEMFLDSSPGYRLPTEAEWEYAARSGGQDEIWAGTSEEDELREYANHSAHFSGDRDDFEYTAPVRRFKANGLGLYDMSGNLWEWCWDWYDPDYYLDSNGVSNPRGPSEGPNRVYRGGSWGNFPQGCRAALRGYNYPTLISPGVGFRLARSSR